MSLGTRPSQDHDRTLALARQHASQLSDQRISAVARAKSTLEEKCGLNRLGAEAKEGIRRATEIAMTPPQQKVRIQRTEPTVRSSKADARRRARHRRQERERMESIVEMEEGMEIAIEDSIEAGIIGARHSEVTGQLEAKLVAVSDVLLPTADDLKEESAATVPPKARASEETLKSLSKDVNEVLKLPDDAEVASMMMRGLEILRMSRDTTLPIRVAPDIYRGASSVSSDSEGASREDQGSETDVGDTESERKHEVSASEGPLLDETVMEELKRAALSDRAGSCEASDTQIANGANNPSDGLIGGKPYLHRLHHVEDRVNWGKWYVEEADQAEFAIL